MCLQNSHFMWVTGKYVFLKGLAWKWKSPDFIGAFFMLCIQYSGLGVTSTSRECPRLVRVLDGLGVDRVWAGLARAGNDKGNI
jgi:hypothetical protein